MLYRIALLSLILPQTVFAWGNYGHRVIGEIAQRNLCPAALATVNTLLSGERLSEASTWADSVRQDEHYRYLKPWHYISMDLGSDFKDATRSSRGDVISAIHEQLGFFLSPLYPRRAEALRLLLHFVGDAHQPFHAGARSDGGGNGVGLTWYGWPTNLHSVWDTRMLKNLNLSFEDLAAELTSPAAPPVAQLAPEDWVTESSLLASGVYPTETELGFAYFQRHIATSKIRLRAAGLRLAGLLNANLGCAH